MITEVSEPILFTIKIGLEAQVRQALPEDKCSDGVPGQLSNIIDYNSEYLYY